MTAKRPNRGGQPDGARFDREPFDRGPSNRLPFAPRPFEAERELVARERVRRGLPADADEPRHGGADANEARYGPRHASGSGDAGRYPILEDLGDEPDTHSVRRGRDRGMVGLVVAIVAFITIAVAKPWDLVPAAHPNPSAAVHAATAQASTPTSDTVSRPFGGGPVQDVPCVNDRVSLIAGGVRAATPSSLPDIPIAHSGRTAYVARAADPSSANPPVDPNALPTSMVIVVQDAGGAQTVATVSSPSGVGPGVWAQVRGWSPDGSSILVAAGRSLPPVDGICSNLFLVASNGSSVIDLTHEGPGRVVVGGTFVKGGRAVAYLESNYLASDYGIALRVIALDGYPVWQGPFCRLDEAGILPVDGLLAVAANGSDLAMLCATRVLSIDLNAPSIRYIVPKTTAIRGAVGWSADDRSILVLEDAQFRGLRPLTVAQFGPGGSTKSASTVSVDWETIVGTTSFSPDGRHAVAVVCSEFSTGECPIRFASIDVTTGEGRVLYDAPPSNGSVSRWLPGGKYVAIAAEGGGSVICVADGSRPPVPSELPPDAAWWSPKQ